MIALTPAAGRLLGGLQFRASLGPMYVARAGRGRYALIAGELGPAQPPLARITAASRDALWDLEQGGLVVVDPAYTLLDYRYRVHLDSKIGRRVELLRAGAAACPRCGAIGAEECSSKNGRRHAARPPVPRELVDQVAASKGPPIERRCPDDGTCHHECGLTGSCFRVVHAGPLSAAHYPGDRWPDDVRAANPRERLRGHL